jgi:hypothetical protein
VCASSETTSTHPCIDTDEPQIKVSGPPAPLSSTEPLSCVQLPTGHRDGSWISNRHGLPKTPKWALARPNIICPALRGLRRKTSQGAGEGPPATVTGWSHPCTTTWFDPMSSTWPEDSPALFWLKRPPGKRATPHLSVWGQVSNAAFTMCPTTGAVGKEVGMHWCYWPLGRRPNFWHTRWL